MFKLGVKVIWSGNHNTTLVPLIKEGTITRVGKETVWLDHQHKAEDQVYASFLWPDTPECRAFLEESLAKRKEYKAWEDDYMKRTFELNNKLIREGAK